MPPSTGARTMPTAAIPARYGRTGPLGAAALLILYAALLWRALAGGAHDGWPLVVAELFVLAGLLAWALGMANAGQLEWCPTAVDKPLALFAVLILLQLAIGNGPLRAWALAPRPPPAPRPSPRAFFSSARCRPRRPRARSCSSSAMPASTCSW